jgi:predicted ATPase
VRGVMELLERESELSAIDDAIEAVRHGVGRAVVVEGLAGIGKTGLLAAARDRAGAAGIQVLTARGSELEREYSYGIVRQLFEPVLARAGNAERRDILKGPATLAEQLVAEPPVGHPPSVAGEESRLHALFWLAVNVAERRHLALMVDDVQWSDAASLRWLGYLLRRMEGVPLLVVLALRPGEPGSEDAQLAALAAVPAAVVLRPAPLSRSAVRALVRATVSPGADDEFCAACHAATAGNPLLLHELLRALVVEGVTPSAHELKRVYSIGPHAVSRAVQLRLATLSPESSALARAVAVLGDNAELAHAAALTGLGDEAAAAAAATLVRVGLLRRELPLTFVHPVVRAAVYEVAPASERARAHAKAAEMLTQHQAPPERVAAHLLVAPPARRPAVVTTLRAAARLALGRESPTVLSRTSAVRSPSRPRPRIDRMSSSSSALRRR